MWLAGYPPCAPPALYRGTSLIRNSLLLGPYGRPMHRALKWFEGGGQFLMSEVPLCPPCASLALYPPRPWGVQAFLEKNRHV